MFTNLWTITKKELSGYFRSRLGYFILPIYIFLVMLGTFLGTDFFARTNETLMQFFMLQNSVLQLVIPAITMKLWTDERRQNTLELLLSQPVSLTAMVLGKFFAAWGICALLLLSVSGLWLLSNFIIPLDNRGILVSFGACLLMSGALCAVCATVSALTSHAVASFMVSLLVCFILSNFNLSAWLQKANISNEVLIRSSQVLDFEQHFINIVSGQLSIANLFYYLSFMALALWFNVAAVEYKRN